MTWVLLIMLYGPAPSLASVPGFASLDLCNDARHWVEEQASVTVVAKCLPQAPRPHGEIARALDAACAKDHPAWCVSFNVEPW